MPPADATVLTYAAADTAPAAAVRRTPRLLDIERAKGFSMFIILCAHIVARDVPRGAEWYLTLKHSVLEVTVLPFFLYLSGLVSARAIDRLGSVPAYARFVRDRALRLLVPFFVFGLVVIAGKLIAARFIFVDNQPTSIGRSLLALVWHTHESSALSVWFLYTLFALSAVLPVLLLLLRGNFAAVFALSVVLYFLPSTDLLYLDRVQENLPAFVAGCFLMHHYDAYTRFLDRHRVALVVLSLLTIALWQFDFDRRLHFILISLAYLPAQHAIIRSPPFDRSNLLLFIGRYAFTIYLLNTIFIGLAKGVLFRFMSWDGLNFAIVGPILYAAGMLGPILVKRYIFPSIPVLDRATD